MRDAFGRLIVPPERLDFTGRVDALRRLQGRLLQRGEKRSDGSPGRLARAPG
jgi:hypothetical protein